MQLYYNQFWFVYSAILYGYLSMPRLIKKTAKKYLEVSIKKTIIAEAKAALNLPSWV